jgi:hypothetical protein
MALEVKRKGYGQVEPNHLSAQYTGQIYAQLPAQDEEGKAIAQLENGQFLKYNYKDNRAGIDGDGEWLLVFNEVKLYDERRQNYKDFVMKADEMADKTIYPRLLKTNIGDIYTTNTFGGAAAGPDAEVAGLTLSVGNKLYVGADGFLAASGDEEGPVFQVVKEYNLGDMQPAVKLQRIK